MRLSKTVLRKISTIFFIILILFSEIGYIVYYAFQQHQIKQEAKKELMSVINEKLLEIIELDKNAAAIRWEEEGKEFTLNGSMYDVKRIEKKAGKTLLYCINDRKEELLIKKMIGTVQKNQHNKKNAAQKFQLPDFLLTNSELQTPGHKDILNKFFQFKETTTSVSKEIVSPPPQV